ncbi:hypothetical protein NQ317_007715 [Molorchus minor]|uniref:Uncharacterized protein n=1 Tax=Molorchus minor TaxID=1323400 RepID=A0ABQ9IYM9_9CUCU|nr:hypothetical protein NQ317_007715 [Molorchus minor]
MIAVVCQSLLQVSKSNSREVTLTDVERETSGEFKCEVSADAPRFHTDIRSAHLLVAGSVIKFSYTSLRKWLVPME